MTRDEILQNIIDRTKSGDLYWISKKGFFESTYNNDTTYCLRKKLVSPDFWSVSNTTIITLQIDGFQINNCYNKLVQELWDILVDLYLEKTFVKTEQSIENFDIAENLINAVLTNKMTWTPCYSGFRANSSTTSYRINRGISGTYYLYYNNTDSNVPIYPSQDKLARLYDVICKSIAKKDLSG